MKNNFMWRVSHLNDILTYVKTKIPCADDKPGPLNYNTNNGFRTFISELK